MVIDEDPFPPIASINIDAIDLRALLNAKKAEGFSPSSRIRKVWIPKQYLVYMDDLEIRRRVSITKKRIKNGRYPYHSSEHSKLEIKKKKFSKGNDVSKKKKRHASQRKNGMNDPSRTKMSSMFAIPPPVSPRKEWYVVKHKKFPQKLTITQKIKM